ncbi:DUF2459 domain-containing protein [Dankookia rubra]|uniref:DUF2459 domain-containing protein n=1 Tax=Dankookia rubra TaxID=1442381 RepID=A0A4R5QIY4_9PROT|nr:DUF2459 domain-containing protein [Dankookia rubra]TDH63003.1 DUF2459 domain-containing protein [Dankookia rubra]
MTIAAVTGRRKTVAAALGLLAGCVRPAPPTCAARPEGAMAWVVDQGWHTEIALDAATLPEPLAGLRALFPGAWTLAFGFGKRSYVLAEAGNISELLLGPLPGPGVIQVKGLRVAPREAWPGRVTALPLNDEGLAALAGFLWESIAPEAAAQSLQGSLFLAASRDYTLGFTCNTWTAAALRRAGLPVDPAGVVLADAVLAQLRPIGCTA